MQTQWRSALTACTPIGLTGNHAFMIVFLDSSALIYYFEGATPYRDAVLKVLQTVKEQHPSATVAISRLGMMECRVQPLREGNADLLARYEAFFQQVQIIELSAEVVDHATRLRAATGLKTPDALQAACALSLAGPTGFVTGDTGFARVPCLAVLLVLHPQAS
jgi:predicted nucleic acid-binding protein